MCVCVCLRVCAHACSVKKNHQFTYLLVKYLCEKGAYHLLMFPVMFARTTESTIFHVSIDVIVPWNPTGYLNGKKTVV